MLGFAPNPVGAGAAVPALNGLSGAQLQMQQQIWAQQQQVQQQLQQQHLQQQHLQHQQLQQQLQQQGQQQQMAQQPPTSQQQPAQLNPQAQQVPASAPVGGNTPQHLIVTGCVHPTVGPIIRGTFALAGENHGRRAYKRDTQVNGLDVMIYYWDERDGPSFCGWWFGPKIGGDQVWAYHPDKVAESPPLHGWKIPYDGPVDPSMVISSSAGGQAVLQQQWPQQPHPGSVDWQQQQMMLQRQQQMQMQMNSQQQQMAQMRQAEANRRRMMEERQRQEMLAGRRSEMVKKQQEELEKRRLEQMAAMAIRRVATKLRIAPPDHLDNVKKELEEIQSRELDKCGSQKDAVERECEYALKQAAAKVALVEESKRKIEEAKAAEEKRRRDQAELAARRLEELSALVVRAEDTLKDLTAKVAALCSLGNTDAIESAYGDLERLQDSAREQAKTCSDFVAEKGSELWEPPRKLGEPEADPGKPTLKTFVLKITELHRAIELTGQQAVESKTKGIKRVLAVAKLSEQTALFRKYDRDQDGLLNRSELQSYAAAEFNFSLPPGVAEEIVHHFAGTDRSGVPVKAFHRAKVALGIAREKARDTQRHKERLERENRMAALKSQLQSKMDEASEVVVSTESAINGVERYGADLLERTKSASSKEIIVMATHMETSLNAAKAKMGIATKAVGGLMVDVDAGLTSFVQGAVELLSARLAEVNASVEKAGGVVERCRGDALKRHTVEMERLRARAVHVIRHHQSESSATNDDLFADFDLNGDQKVDKSEFLDFFKRCKLPSADDRVLTGEELDILFNYLDENGTGAIRKDAFLDLIRCYMRVAIETVVTDNLPIKGSKMLRRLEIDEMCEVLEGPSKEEAADIMRVRVRLMRDSIEGWVTPVGNQGTVFLQSSELRMKVVKETVLTNSFEIAASLKTLRMLEEGETVVVREWVRTATSGLQRVKVKSADGQVGWATVVGTTGTTFLEVC